MSDFSLEQVSNVVSVTEPRLRYWQSIGLFPRRNEGYDWADLQRAKLLSRLVEEGVPATRLVPYAPVLEGHAFHGESRALVVDDPAGQREVESGQFLLSFQDSEQTEESKVVHYLPQADEWERQAQLALHEGDTEHALELAIGALEIVGDDLSALNNLGLLFMDLEEYKFAQETLYRACHHAEAGARQWFNLAHSFEAAGDPESAVQALEQSLIEDPNFSAGRFNLAYTCETLGQSTKAYQHWKSFLRRHPDSEDADRIRKHLTTFYGGDQVIPLHSIP
jgi:tetratricopeptide (TPR) repeat protein